MWRSVHALIAIGCSPMVVYSMLKYLASHYAKKLATTTEDGDPNATIIPHNSTVVAAADTASIEPLTETARELENFLLGKSKFINDLLAPCRNLDSQFTVLSRTSNRNIIINNDTNHPSNYNQTNKGLTNKPRMLPSHTLKHNN
ncbi:unnamed protein product [Trichobilharzia regenti]|nr:unnamed protein product [Trichobilharzia regenti]